MGIYKGGPRDPQEAPRRHPKEASRRHTGGTQGDPQETPRRDQETTRRHPGRGGGPGRPLIESIAGKAQKGVLPYISIETDRSLILNLEFQFLNLEFY